MCIARVVKLLGVVALLSAMIETTPPVRATVYTWTGTSNSIPTPTNWNPTTGVTGSAANSEDWQFPDATTLGKPELDLIRVERLVAAPPGTPPDIVNVLSAALGKALVDPVVTKWAVENDVVMIPRTPQEAVATLNQQRAFFEKYKSSLSAS